MHVCIDIYGLYVPTVWSLLQGLLFRVFKGGLRVSSGSVSWYGSSYGTGSDSSGIPGRVPENKSPPVDDINPARPHIHYTTRVLRVVVYSM